MTRITLRILDGADRGRVFQDVPVPLTIGREEGNPIQLNDDRVSRFHVKIQQDHDDFVLTDLESTNGCKVNNEEVRLRILRHGDLISVGRSTLIYGTREQINRRLERLSSSSHSNSSGVSESVSEQDPILAKKNWQEDPNYQLAILDLEPPQIPDRLTPGQAAQLSELIEYLHMQVRRIVTDAEVNSEKKLVELTNQEWQKILDLQSRLAEYLHAIGQP